MASDSDQKTEPEWLRNLPARSHEIGFSPAELIACSACRKMNPPTRPACLYCGTSLGYSGLTKLDLREPEDWENGFNVVAVDASGANIDGATPEVASLLGVERELFVSMLTAGKAVPLVRVGSESQAAAVAERLVDFGIKTRTLTDDSLSIASPPIRLRSITFDADGLKLELFNAGTRPLKRDQLALIVTGLIRQGRTESIEQRKLRGSKLLSEVSTTSDDPVIDIYPTNDPAGYRIPATGFDFSCLGAEKSLMVGENMKRLTAKLADVFTSGKLVDDYSRLRPLLEHAWPTESRRESQHLGLGRKKVSNIFTSNNATQFTRYSRLQWLLYEEKI